MQSYRAWCKWLGPAVGGTVCFLKLVSANGQGGNGVTCSLLPRVGSLYLPFFRKPLWKSKYVPLLCLWLLLDSPPSPCLCPSCSPARQHSTPFFYLKHYWVSQLQILEICVVQTPADSLGSGEGRVSLCCGQCQLVPRNRLLHWATVPSL